MAARLSISELQNVLSTLGDITSPYQLGIQLNIDPSKLKEIERNHHGDTNRQKTEVIEHWLRNSQDASWTTLANAVERMGGHDNLAQTLRTFVLPGSDVVNSSTEQMSLPRHVSICTPLPAAAKNEDVTLTECLEGVPFTILLLGMCGHGKSTVGNKLLNSERYFRINSNLSPQLCKGSAMLKSKSQLKNYNITVYDHDGFIEGHYSLKSLLSDLPSKLDLVLFVVKRGHKFWSNHQKKLITIISTWKIGQISAVVLTHCERLSEDDRGLCTRQFKADNPSIAELMGKGILTVGFPEDCHIPLGSHLRQNVAADRKKLRELIYSCNEGVVIPQPDNNPQGSDSDDTRPILTQDVSLEMEHSSEDKTCCCLIM